MATAVCLIRMQPHYRHDAFLAGLTRLGLKVTPTPAKTISAEDVLVIWNRSLSHEQLARRYELAGAAVIVAENGYLDAVDEHGHQWFSLALGYHNGAGTWFYGDAERWPQLRLDIQPWRAAGASVLVLPQRGMGPLGVRMPQKWEGTALTRLRRLTRRPVRVRPHPGIKSRGRPLTPDLENCHAVVTWASGAALKAIQAGIPAYYDFPRWVGACAALPFGEVSDLEAPRIDDAARLAMFERLAWCQWRVAEIASGAALAWLLEGRRRGIAPA